MIQLDIDILKDRYPERWREVAMDGIWHSWYKPLRAFIRVGFNPGEAADDLMQDIMTKVFLNLDRYDKRYALSTWLYTIARNVCLNHGAHERRAPGGLSAEPAASGSVEGTVIAGEIEREVWRHVGMLEPDDRALAFLVFYEQAPYKRIGEVFGWPPSTVKNRVFRLRAFLRARMGEYHEN